MRSQGITSGVNSEPRTDHLEVLPSSFERRVSKQWPIITPQQQLTPIVKGILKKSPSSPATIVTTVCSKCKSTATSTVPQHDEQRACHIPEKEVEVKKERNRNLADQKKINFHSVPKGETVDEGVSVPRSIGGYHAADIPAFESLPLCFPTVFLNRKTTSIIGNNEFWLPKCTFTEDSKSTKEEIPAVGRKDFFNQQEYGINQNYDFTEQKTENRSELEVNMIEFFNNIFKETTKRCVKILQVAMMINNSLVTLTNEYVFECKSTGNGTSFEIVDAVPLKDVQSIMVDDSCTVITLEVCRAPLITEFKEFVPGFPEKTEQLISLMVYALSRIQSCLPDVYRLPLLSLPNFKSIANWLQEQEEDVVYCGIALAKNVSGENDFDCNTESFMVKINGHQLFHPMMLLLSRGQLSSKCNGSCNLDTCEHSVTLKLKDCVIHQKDQPRPNSILLQTRTQNQFTIACPSKESADNLVKKLYDCLNLVYQDSNQYVACVVVTKYCLQIFNMTQSKPLIFGSPLLNLDISDSGNNKHSCFIDTEGIEAGNDEIFTLQNRWQLDFLSDNEKQNFLLRASSMLSYT